MEKEHFSIADQYTDELKTRAVNLVIHAQADPNTANGAVRRVAKELAQIFHQGSDGRPNPFPKDSRRPSPLLPTPQSA